MPTFVVKLAPASQADTLRLKIKEEIEANLPFGFPDYRFRFVEEYDVAQQFTVLPPLGGKPDELAEVQATVDRIATLNPPKPWS